jgi:hypothetical protein
VRVSLKSTWMAIQNSPPFAGQEVRTMYASLMACRKLPTSIMVVVGTGMVIFRCIVGTFQILSYGKRSAALPYNRSDTNMQEGKPRERLSTSGRTTGAVPPSGTNQYQPPPCPIFPIWQVGRQTCKLSMAGYIFPGQSQSCSISSRVFPLVSLIQRMAMPSCISDITARKRKVTDPPIASNTKGKNRITRKLNTH